MSAPGYEKQFAELVGQMEDLIEDARKDQPEISEDAHDAFDAAEPVLSDLQDLLADVDEAMTEGDE
jgi:hypothetical protein